MAMPLAEQLSRVQRMMDHTDAIAEVYLKLAQAFRGAGLTILEDTVYHHADEHGFVAQVGYKVADSEFVVQTRVYIGRVTTCEVVGNEVDPRFSTIMEVVFGGQTIEMNVRRVCLPDRDLSSATMGIRAQGHDVPVIVEFYKDPSIREELENN